MTFRDNIAENAAMWPDDVNSVRKDRFSVASCAYSVKGYCRT